MITKKPSAKSPDEFISGAKAEKTKAEDLLEVKDKTFLLRIPYRLWEQARKKAGSQGISLHEFILKAMNEAVIK